MPISIYDVVKAPMGWAIYCDGVRIGGVFDGDRGSFLCCPRGLWRSGQRTGRAWILRGAQVITSRRPMTDPQPDDLLIATVAGLLAYMITLGLRVAFGS